MRSISAWLVLAILIVLFTNTIALVGVSGNRAGTPVETIELTERELPLQSMGQDNSGIGLLLRWIRPQVSNQDAIFTREQLERIGFDFRARDIKPLKEVALLPRPAFVVLEYNGDRYRQWQERRNVEITARKQEESNAGAQKRSSLYETEDPETVSRLFPADVGNDPAELRSRYPDQSRYLIMSGVIGARIQYPETDDKGALPGISGFVQQILPFYINVPLPYSRLLAPLKPQIGKPPRYTVTLSFGRKLEPWVIAVKLN